ncbi:NAD(P)H-binding protein [Lichenifustis flavocetrariae]|uniref:NAD(P)H-binding protein n=1 Tax=Lichenifustis flavocetrariae TaxID=2949735 RepID=A0AA42CMW3_9HYPH|nr:NAD(P)H-binding protein [Lichenifustis flavocetrariae]MCW6512016.1 NAD(P)H-binding protein [Lichenifustis flavocetrariae]
MIVVTTPTGNIGRHVVRHLLDAGEALRLIVRDPSKLPQDVRGRVEVVEGSHGDAAVVDQAFRGADAVFWVCPPSPAPTPAAATVDFARPGTEAMRRHGVPYIVAVTTLGRDTPWQERAGNATGSIHMVDLLRTTGAAVRGIALPAFMDNALRMVGAIREGRIPGPIAPDKKLPHTAARDSGAAAAGLLIDRSWSGQEDVPVLGPEELSYADLAAIVSEVTGREVRYKHQTYEAYKETAMARGLTDAFAQGFVDMLRAKEEGMDNVASRATPIIGATSFRQWVEEVLQPALAG